LHRKTAMRPSRGVCIDASALVDLLLGLPRAKAVTQVLEGVDVMVAPDHVNVEVLGAIRRKERVGDISPARAAKAVAALADAPVRRLPTTGMLEAVWALGANLAPFDAGYVVTARSLGVPLLTADLRLARALDLGVAVIGV
jgi:predicted nucleic acid-binding protein